MNSWCDAAFGDVHQKLSTRSLRACFGGLGFLLAAVDDAHQRFGVGRGRFDDQRLRNHAFGIGALVAKHNQQLQRFPGHVRSGARHGAAVEITLGRY